MNRKTRDSYVGCVAVIAAYIATICFFTWLVRWVIS